MTAIHPCYGRSRLFDSLNIADHLEAKTYCDTCPVIDWCGEQLSRAQAAAPGGQRSGGPQGTWAGKLVGAVGVCGTDSGRRRHYRDGESPCDACRAARQKADRDRRAGAA